MTPRLRFVVALYAVLIVAVIGSRHARETQLLRADPDTLAADEALMNFAKPPGRALFLDHCASCHGGGGRGDPSRGIPDLSDHDWLYGSGRIADIEQVVENGIRSRSAKAWNLAIMPAYGTVRPSPRDTRLGALNPAEIRDVIEYLFAAQRRAADAAAVERGRAVYFRRGGCDDCHASDARGDSAIGAPDLTDRVTLYGDGSRQALFLSIAFGRQGICPGWSARLGAAAIRELAVFVYSLSSPADGHANPR